MSIPPLVETVHVHIKTITQRIQELLQAAQSHQQAKFRPSSVKVFNAVDTLTRIFPQASFMGFICGERNLLFNQTNKCLEISNHM